MKKMYPISAIPCGLCKYVGHGVIYRPSHDIPLVADFYKCDSRLVYTTDNETGGGLAPTNGPARRAIIKAFIASVKDSKAMTKDELDQFLLSIT